MIEKKYGILIHGGTRSNRDFDGDLKMQISSTLKKASCNAFNILDKHSLEKEENDKMNNELSCAIPAIDAVESAVVDMEDSGLFDAGPIGSYPTIEGKVEMDASIMSGKDISTGSVGMVQKIKNPIKLARIVMEKTDHVMIVAEGALKLARLFDIEGDICMPTDYNMQKYNRFVKDLGEENDNVKREYPNNHKFIKKYLQKNDDCHYGTVGAVAIDREGNVASAVSTGGRAFKVPGRIGDSAIIGAGLYADNKNGAVCNTGLGESIIRLCLAKTACDSMGFHPLSCCHDSSNPVNRAMASSSKAIELLSSRFGHDTGGIIAVDSDGNFGASLNTKSMPISLFTSSMKEPKVAFNNEEYGLLFSNC
jgi:beta-aspartyl-peptidase (threonine type)